MPPKFNVRTFVSKVAALIARNSSPAMTTRIYAHAANKVRLEANKPENAREQLAFQIIAAKFDELSAEAIIPEIEPDSGEEIHGFSDGSRIPTEYEGLVNDIAESKVGHDGEPVDEIESQAVLAQLQQARERDVAPPVQIVPASVRPEKLGDSALVQFGGTLTNFYDVGFFRLRLP